MPADSSTYFYIILELVFSTAVPLKDRTIYEPIFMVAINYRFKFRLRDLPKFSECVYGLYIEIKSQCVLPSKYAITFTL